MLLSQEPLEASLVLGSFGSTKGSATPVFDFTVKLDPATTVPSYEKPLRYGKLAEIHHIFRDDPKNPPKIVSIAFALAVLATVPALFIGVCFIDHHGRDTANAYMLTCGSGLLLAETLHMCKRLWEMLPYRMLFSSDQSLRWRVSSFSTTRSGTCSRLCRRLAPLALPPS